MPLLKPSSKTDAPKRTPAVKSKGGDGAAASKKATKSRKSNDAKDKKEKEKKPKQDKGPKKPPTAMAAWKKEHRKVIKDANSELDAKELNALLKDKWEKLSDKEKKNYEEQAKAKLEEWKEENAQWTADHPDEAAALKKPKKESKKRKKSDDESEDSADTSEDAAPKKRSKKAKKTGEPKRPLTSYLRFCGENRAKVVKENPDVEKKEILVMLGALWRELPGPEKARFTDEYNKEKEQYAIAKKAWDEKYGEDAASEESDMPNHNGAPASSSADNKESSAPPEDNADENDNS